MMTALRISAMTNASGNWKIQLEIHNITIL